MSRPEDHLPPDLYYSDKTSAAYTTSSRIQHIQSQMTHRSLSLLSLPGPSLVLDIGCGSGLSGEILSSPLSLSGADADAEVDAEGHTWIGLDISPSMLSVAKLERDVDGDLLLADMGQGLPFRPGTFDAAISISAVQWLCNADSAEESQQPERRLRRFFNSLYVVLRRGARAVLQFYPRDKRQRDMICDAAIKAGFGAGVLVDDEGSKAEKLYLVCTVGGGDVTSVLDGIDGVDVDDDRRRNVGRGGRRSDSKGSKGWIIKKKEQMARKGKVVKADSRYTGRKRKLRF